jgi:hypothetical protein
MLVARREIPALRDSKFTCAPSSRRRRRLGEGKSPLCALLVSYMLLAVNSLLVAVFIDAIEGCRTIGSPDAIEPARI